MRLKRHFSIVLHSPDVVELRYGVWNPVSYTLTDESGTGQLARILRRLDGSSTIAEIAKVEGVGKADIDTLIDQLAELKLVEDGPTHALDHYLDYLAPNLLPYAAIGEVANTSAILVGDAHVADRIADILVASELKPNYSLRRAEPRFNKLLLECGAKWLTDGLAFEEGVQAFAEWRDHFVIFAFNTVNPIASKAFNRISLHFRIPWIHAAVDGPFLLVGPTIVPSRSPCYECLETRVLMNLREAASYQSYKRALWDGQTMGLTSPLDATLEAMLASLTAFDALNFMLTGASFTVGKMLSLYLPTMEFSFNELLRVPGCPACSPPPEREDTDLYFNLRTLIQGAA